MARIRSVHPGLFTDETFVSLSADAQIFLIGLWTEADDQGVFEWKPVTLRMRLRPTKDGPVEVLLAELAEADCIRMYQHGGRNYGAIRNFRKYQRPKTPNAVHPITAEIRKYVALPGPASEVDTALPEPIPEIQPDELAEFPKSDPVRQPNFRNRRRSTADISEIEADKRTSFPRNGEIASQMEDGGKDVGEKNPPPPVSVAASGADAVVAAFLRLRDEHWPNESRLPAPTMTIRREAEQFLEAGGTPELIAEVLARGMAAQAAAGKSAPSSLKAYRLSLTDAIAGHNRPVAAAKPPERKVVAGRETQCRDPAVISEYARLDAWLTRNRFWVAAWGDEPTDEAQVRRRLAELHPVLWPDEAVPEMEMEGAA